MNAKQLADMCQVHYNTMRKWLNDNQVKKAHKGKNATYIIDDEIVKKAKQHFNVDVVEQEYNNSTTDSHTTVELLANQLAEKDRQIANQQKHISELNETLKREQELNLIAQNKILLLENTQTDEQHQEQQQPPQEHKNIFKKLFKK